MKKIRNCFPVLLLVCAGMVMMYCTSEAEPPISGANIVLKGGKYQFLFDDPKIEHGLEYEIIFTIEDCDEAFVGSRLGGKICYKMDLDSDDEKVLSGWAYAVPALVSKDIKEYTWTFKAGEANADDVAIANPATTPADGKQYFALTAQKGYDNYGPNDNFNVKGEFKVVPIESVSDWISGGTLTLGNDDGIAGKGELSADDTARIREMPANSKITLTVNATVGDDPGPGWGVCSIGVWDSTKSIEIKIPAGTPNGSQTFTADIKISDLLKTVPPSNNIVINAWKCTVTKAELFRPKT